METVLGPKVLIKPMVSATNNVSICLIQTFWSQNKFVDCDTFWHAIRELKFRIIFDSVKQIMGGWKSEKRVACNIRTPIQPQLEKFSLDHGYMEFSNNKLSAQQFAPSSSVN